MAPHLPPQPLNDSSGLNPSPSHRSYENQLFSSSEASSGVNFQPLTGQHPQHGHEGQLEQEQLMTPRIPFQPRSIQNTHHDQRWLEEEEVLQKSRDGHDHESQARFEDNETLFGREEARLFRPIAQIQDYRDEQLDENQELRGSQEMLAQLEEQMEQGGLGQQRDGTIPSLATGFVHQRSQDLQDHQSPYDPYNLDAASSQVYFQQQPDQHGHQLSYQGTQRGDQNRWQNEGQPLQMGSNHVEGHEQKWQPSDDGAALPQRENAWSHLPPTCDDRPLAWTHLENEGPNFDSLPEKIPYSYTDQQVQQSSWVADPVPWSPHGMDFDLWRYLPQQVAYDHPDQEGQQSMYTSQTQEAIHAQRPAWRLTSPDIQSWAAAPVPSSPYSTSFDTVSPRDLLLQQTAYDHPNQQGQQSMYIDQPEQAAYVQQPTWHSTPTENQSWVATPVPSSPSGWESDSPSLWEDLPQQVANGRRDHQGQQSTDSRQPEQVAYGQQPIWDSTSPRIQSRAATPIPSNPPGMNLDSMTPSRLRIGNQAFNLPFDRSRDDLIKQAKTRKPTHVIKKSKRSQKKRNLEGLTAGYAVEAPPETGSRAASRHCPTCTCTQALSVSSAYNPPSEPNMPPVRNSQKRRMHENSPQQPNLRRSKRKTAHKGHI